MGTGSKLPKWAPRAEPGKIRRLYETDAMGLVDEELIDEVAYGLYARCQSILTVTEAHSGRVKCPACGQVVEHHGDREEILHCEGCSWETTWGRYFASYQRRQLYGGAATGIFRAYVERFPRARTPQQKMILIDWIIHECHQSAVQSRQQLYGRPVAVNLIDGRIREVIALLEGLAYGNGSTPGALEARDTWRQRVLTAYRPKNSGR